MIEKQEMDSRARKSIYRLLKLTAKQSQSGLPIALTANGYKIKYAGRLHSFAVELIDQIKTEKLVSLEDDRILITYEGMKLLTKINGSEEAGGAQRKKQNWTGQSVDGVVIDVNLSESPLMRLYRRKSRKGKAYLEEFEFQAGERIRRDFEIAQLQPRITANYSFAAGSAGKGGRYQSGEISDFAIDARRRVDNAVSALSPELSGVVLDVCCFLKGLETVERERNWPPRSAKLMLKTGLSILAKHYGFSGFENQKSSSLVSWGAEDAKPDFPHLG